MGKNPHNTFHNALKDAPLNQLIGEVISRLPDTLEASIDDDVKVAVNPSGKGTTSVENQEVILDRSSPDTQKNLNPVEDGHSEKKLKKKLKKLKQRVKKLKKSNSSGKDFEKKRRKLEKELKRLVQETADLTHANDENRASEKNKGSFKSMFVFLLLKLIMSIVLSLGSKYIVPDKPMGLQEGYSLWSDMTSQLAPHSPSPTASVRRSSPK